jgi:3'(2'), 5'-bisphosphate nucleotidase
MSGFAALPESGTTLERLVALARLAGDATMRFYGASYAVEEKSGGRGPVTDADRASHEIIVEALTRDALAPVISEEGTIADYETRRAWPQFWLVDPLDGTKEFLSRNGEFTVNIALIREGVPVIGVVHVPATGTTFFASQGCGAWRQRGDEAAQRLLSDPPMVGAPLRVVESRSHHSEALEAFLATVPVAERAQLGSSLKFCRIAEGRADLYPRLSPIMEWDVAAGDCVYRYSGRSRARLSPLRYNNPDLRIPRFVLGMEDAVSPVEALR